MIGKGVAAPCVDTHHPHALVPGVATMPPLRTISPQSALGTPRQTIERQGDLDESRDDEGPHS